VDSVLKDSLLSFLYKKKKKIRKKIRKISSKIKKKLPVAIRIRIISLFLKKSHPIESSPGKVVMVCPSLDSGGAQRQVVNTLVTLNERLGDIVLLCDFLGQENGYDNGFYLPIVNESGAKARTIRKGLHKSSNHKLQLRTKWLIELISSKLAVDVVDLYYEFRELKPEVVHAWLDWSNIRVGLAALLAGVPKIILSGRNVSPKHFELNVSYFYPIYKVLARYDDRRVIFINNSEAGAIDYADWLGLHHSRIQVLRNGVSFDPGLKTKSDYMENIKSRLNIPKSSKIVGGMFRFNKEKNPMLWLETARQILIDDKTIHFVLYGDGPMRVEMEGYIKDNDLNGNIHLMGKISPAIKGLSICEVILLTSEKEGTPNVLLEAQWLGLPVVTTDAGGAAEAVWDNVTGIVVHSFDSIAVSNAVKYCLYNKDIKNTAQSKGPMFISERYGLSRMVQDTISLYDLN